MSAFNPYLNFNGNTEDAFIFYKSVLGGEFAQVMRFKDVPGGAGQLESEEDKIMHIALPVGNGNMLMGTDVTSNMPQVSFGTNFSICISPDSEQQAHQVFNGLAEGGSVIMPLEKMFWGDWFGQLTDKYGVQWMMNYSEKKDSAGN
jgi:PhnB protein